VPLELTRIVSDDLNTPQAVAFLSQITGQLLTVLIETDMVKHFETMLQGIDELFGLGLMDLLDITDEQKQLIAERNQARSDQDWDKSDKLRDNLVAQGIGLRDTPQGAIWFPL